MGGGGLGRSERRRREPEEGEVERHCLVLWCFSEDGMVFEVWHFDVVTLPGREPSVPRDALLHNHM